MLNNNLHKKDTYKVEGIFWVPSYRDFDYDEYTVNAYTKKQAEHIAKKHWMWQFAKKLPYISKVEQDKTKDPRAPKWAADLMEQLIDDHVNSDLNR